MRKLLAVGIVVAFGVFVAHGLVGFPNSNPVRADGPMTDALKDWLSVQAIVGEGSPSDTLAELDQIHLQTGVGAKEPHPRTPGALLVQLPMAAATPGAVHPILVATVVGSVAFLAWSTRLSWPWILVIGCGLMLTPPVKAAMWVGSQAPLIAALIALTWLQADKPSGGVWLGVAATLKLFPGLLIPMLWMQGQRKLAYTSAGMFGGLNLAGLLLPDVTVWSSLASLTGQKGAVSPSNLSLHLPLLAVVGVVAVLLWWSRRLSSRSVVVVGSVAMLALSPVVWNHYLIILAVPLVLGAEAVQAYFRSSGEVSVVGEYVDRVDSPGVTPEDGRLRHPLSPGRRVR